MKNSLRWIVCRRGQYPFLKLFILWISLWPLSLPSYLNSSKRVRAFISDLAFPQTECGCLTSWSPSDGGTECLGFTWGCSDLRCCLHLHLVTYFQKFCIPLSDEAADFFDLEGVPSSVDLIEMVVQRRTFYLSRREWMGSEGVFRLPR